MQTAADVIGFNKDYFCRFFKQCLGVSFVKYLNHVKMDHIYHDLIETDEEILQILEKHDFENQKLFYCFHHPRETTNLVHYWYTIFL